MAGEVGTWPWAERTGGKLSTGDKMRILREAVVAQVADLLRPLRGSNRGAGLDLSAIPIPDSRLATDAVRLCEEVSTAALTNHCFRTYVWGALLAQKGSLKHDAELFFTAAMLHDLGLTEPYDRKDATAHCFAVEGARGAESFLKSHECPDKCKAIREAISLHLNVTVPIDQGVEAHLLHEGAALDVIGLRYGELGSDVVASVLERYPRFEFKKELVVLMGNQVRARKDSRVAFLFRVAQFDKRVMRAPFSS